jgi:hypothetical protein
MQPKRLLARQTDTRKYAAEAMSHRHQVYQDSQQALYSITLMKGIIYSSPNNAAGAVLLFAELDFYTHALALSFRAFHWKRSSSQSALAMILSLTLFQVAHLLHLAVCTPPTNSPPFQQVKAAHQQHTCGYEELCSTAQFMVCTVN